MGYVPGERCMLQGVKKLPPAHALLFDCKRTVAAVALLAIAGSGRLGGQGRADEAALLNELESLLEDAVRRQLVADVPVGVLLSGGVDSSLVTAMAVRAAPKVKTFTIRFPGYGQYDETEHARLIARHFGTEHVELAAAETGVDLLPLLARRLRRANGGFVHDSHLSGQPAGARALHGRAGRRWRGRVVRRLSALQPPALAAQRLGRIPPLPAPAGGQAAQAWLPVGFKGRNWLQGLGVDLRTGLPLIFFLFDREAPGGG